MADDNNFRPYKIIQQTGSTLQLQAGTRATVIRAAFLAGPLVMVIMGTVLYFTQHDPLFLYLLYGIALLEFILFSFIKLPSDLRVDNMGFTLKRVSLKSTEQVDYLWNDVDRIRCRLVRTKGGSNLVFDAVMKEGKNLRLLNFSNFNPKAQSAAEIAAVLAQISRKTVAEK